MALPVPMVFLRHSLRHLNRPSAFRASTTTLINNQGLNFPIRRYASGDVAQKDKELGESDDTADTGVIEKTNQETLLYFNNVLPFDLSRFRIFRFVHDLIKPKKPTKSLKKHILQLSSPESNPIDGISINSLFTKDGGVFVKFQVPFDSSIPEINTKIQENAKNAPSPYFGLIPKPQCYPVKGTPWVEDLRRYPSNQLKVLFDGEDLTEESLYQLFRRYGPIIDIIPQAPDSKEVPRYAIVKFRKLRSAIAAKNCVNAFQVGNTIVHIKYQRVMRENMFKDFVFNHTRISVPLILTVLLAIAAIIFEPIREFFVQEKIEKRFALSYKDNKYFRWISDYFNRMKRFMGSSHSSGSGLNHVWSERVDKIKELKLWLTENVNTFIVVRGPKGIGKQEVVMDHALQDRKNVLLIDCEALVKSRNDADFLKNTSRQTGYFPIFPWLNSLSSFIDLGVQGLTGQKSGFSESSETQFKNILSLTAVAIRRASLRFYKAYVNQTAHDPHMADDATQRITEEDYLQQHPDEKPVIVINKFSAKSEKYSFVYSSLANWAAFLISMNIAHVIFLVDDISPMPVLTEVLPDQVFKHLVLSDASKESSAEYVLSQLNKDDELDSIKEEKKEGTKASYKPKYSTKIIEEALDPIGGRMLDLQAFVRRVKSGETPQEAQREMTKQAAEQIIQMNLSEKSKEDDEFLIARSWEIIKLLAGQETVPFSKIYTSALFKSSPVEYLSQLEKSNLISLVKQKGIVKDIRASRPLYRSAFKNIVEDERTFNVLETLYLMKLISYETKNINKFESELNTLGYVAGADAVKVRFEYLGNKITGSTNSIQQYESQIKDLVAKSNEQKKSKSTFAIF